MQARLAAPEAESDEEEGDSRPLTIEWDSITIEPHSRGHPPVGRITPFVNYAIKFEQAYASGDWTIVAPCFTEDAIYAVTGAPGMAGEHVGRAAVLAHFDGMIRGFDQRFASREVLVLEGPEERGDHVYMRWAAIYRLTGAPDLRLEGRTRAFFRGDQMSRLEDEIPAEYAERTTAHLAQHGAKLAPPAETR